MQLALRDHAGKQCLSTQCRFGLFLATEDRQNFRSELATEAEARKTKQRIESARYLGAVLSVARNVPAVTASRTATQLLPMSFQLQRAGSRVLQEDTEVSARLAASWMNLDTILSLRRGNDRKAGWLNYALRLQVLAILLLAIAAAWEVHST
jgi:hypothetical protein